MGAPWEYSEELRDRATRMAVDARQDSATRVGAIERVADRLGVHPEALRTSVKQVEVDSGMRRGTTSENSARIAEFEREVRKLRRANTILKQTLVFFAAELDRPSR